MPPPGHANQGLRLPDLPKACHSMVQVPTPHPWALARFEIALWEVFSRKKLDRNVFREIIMLRSHRLEFMVNRLSALANNVPCIP